jgi:hypothetical protein
MSHQSWLADVNRRMKAMLPKDLQAAFREFRDALIEGETDIYCLWESITLNLENRSRGPWAKAPEEVARFLLREEAEALRYHRLGVEVWEEYTCSVLENMLDVLEQTREEA